MMMTNIVIMMMMVMMMTMMMVVTVMRMMMMVMIMTRSHFVSSLLHIRNGMHTLSLVKYSCSDGDAYGDPWAS